MLKEKPTEEEFKRYEKDGQLSGSVGAIIQLIVGVGVATLVLIFIGSLGGQAYEITEDDINLLYGSVANETATVYNVTTATTSLAHDDIIGSSIVILNGSNVANNSHFTFDYELGTVYTTNMAYNGSALNFSYSYGNETIVSSIKNSIISSFDALESTGSYLPIIVLAVVIALVLFLVLGSIGGFGGSGRNNAL